MANWDVDHPFRADNNGAYVEFYVEGDAVMLDGVFSQEEIMAIWRRFNELKGVENGQLSR